MGNKKCVRLPQILKTDYLKLVLARKFLYCVIHKPSDFFRAKKSTACLPRGGSKAVSHVADLRGMSKNPGFTWKSKSQAKLTGHLSPIIPSFVDRGLSCRLHVEAPRGEKWERLKAGESNGNP